MIYSAGMLRVVSLPSQSFDGLLPFSLFLAFMVVDVVFLNFIGRSIQQENPKFRFFALLCFFPHCAACRAVLFARYIQNRRRRVTLTIIDDKLYKKSNSAKTRVGCLIGQKSENHTTRSGDDKHRKVAAAVKASLTTIASI
jgi:hypothetical protein